MAPKNALEAKKHVTLTADMFFTNEMPFLLTCSRKLCFLTCKFLENHTGTQLFESLTKVIMFCKNKGFAIQHLLPEPELECLKTTMNAKHGMEVNPGLAKEHVANMEWQMCAVKDQQGWSLSTQSATVLNG